MKKFVWGVALAAVALVLTGCGGKPKIPENTVAACYIDLEKCVDNGKDIAELIIDNLPKSLKGLAEEQFEDFLKTYKEEIKPYDLEWATVTVGKGENGPEVSLVVKCDYEEKGKSGESLVSQMKALAGGTVTSKLGVDVCRASLPALGKSYMAFVDKCYVIVTDNETVLEKMIRLYKDGEGETSDAFDDLTDLGSDTVARFQTADVETIVDIFDLRRDLERWGETCDDEDLVDDILDVGNITLDINLSDDILGCELTIEAGSKQFAKAVEGLFHIVAIVNRLTADGVAAAGEYAKLLPNSVRSEIEGAAKMLKADTLKELSKMMRDGLEVDRSGSTVKIAYGIDTEDLVELIAPFLENR